MNDNFLQIIIWGIVFIIIILTAVLIYAYVKDKINKKEEDNEIEDKKNEDNKQNKKSIFEFMEFDNIEDNMIVQDKGKRYLMVIECKGVNYDLLSSIEKISIEQGFIGFLNSLKFEIQLYIQTKKVNLNRSILKYKERLKIIENDLRDEEIKYENMQRDANVSKDEILKEIRELTKKRNLYEYSLDIINNTEQMSEDRDLTIKEYYIIIPYYTEEITSVGEYDKREICSMAFSELYTRAQAIVSSLTECEIRGRILNSQELIELLFIAYNREQHDIYDFEKYINKSGFQSYYTNTESVLNRKMKVLDEQILNNANQKAFEAYQRASLKEQKMRKAIEEREKRMDEYVNNIAEEILDSEVNNLGTNMINSAKKELHEMYKEKEAILNKKTENKTNKKEKKELTEEERKKRIALLKKKKMLKSKKNESQ